MKKILIVLLLFAMLLLISCANPSSPRDDTSSEVFADDIISTFVPGESTTMPSSSPTEDLIPYDFDSYEEFIGAFYSTIDGENDSLHAKKHLWGMLFAKYVDTVTDRKYIYVPTICGNPISLRNKVGYSTIALFKHDMYEAPETWFYALFEGGEDITIRINEGLLLLFNYAELPSQVKFSELLYSYNRNAPNIHNHEDFPNYDMIYEEEIQLEDQAVCALIIKMENDPRYFVEFYYNGMIVSCDMRESTFMRRHEFFADFSIAPYYLDE